MSIFGNDLAEDGEQKSRERAAAINRSIAVAVAVITVVAAFFLLTQGGGHPPAIVLLPGVVLFLSPFAAFGAWSGMRSRKGATTFPAISMVALGVNMLVALFGGAMLLMALVSLVLRVVASR